MGREPIQPETDGTIEFRLQRELCAAVVERLIGFVVKDELRTAGRKVEPLNIVEFAQAPREVAVRVELQSTIPFEHRVDVNFRQFVDFTNFGYLGSKRSGQANRGRLPRGVDERSPGRIEALPLEKARQVEGQRHQRDVRLKRQSLGIVTDEQRQRLAREAACRRSGLRFGQLREEFHRFVEAALGHEQPGQAKLGTGTGLFGCLPGKFQAAVAEGVGKQPLPGQIARVLRRQPIVADLFPEPEEPRLPGGGVAGQGRGGRRGFLPPAHPQVVAAKLERRPRRGVVGQDLRNQRGPRRRRLWLSGFGGSCRGQRHQRTEDNEAQGDFSDGRQSW